MRDKVIDTLFKYGTFVEGDSRMVFKSPGMDPITFKQQENHMVATVKDINIYFTGMSPIKSDGVNVDKINLYYNGLLVGHINIRLKKK